MKARDRAEAHLERLKTVAAASAATASLLACGGADAADPTPTPPPEPPGYGVVDPMPPPAMCEDMTVDTVPSFTNGYGTWRDEHGKLVLELTLQWAWRVEDRAKFTQLQLVSGAKFVKNPQGTGTKTLTMTLLPDAGAKEIKLASPVVCGPVATTIRWTVPLPATAKAGDTLYVDADPPPITPPAPHNGAAKPAPTGYPR